MDDAWGRRLGEFERFEEQWMLLFVESPKRERERESAWTFVAEEMAAYVVRIESVLRWCDG